ncbi:LAETG motif-containing sortase-dependent surface protein [Streptomyces sp. TG1A-8]|uniref:LAETG motif-containing sortase-dependent surface protein n=1 Tax=Streptomyces sp. TG1A-8 TaxID=3051385 RepID=UPI00265BB67D|nr:LAETG motif-containing sortase-dependent surface protein [Streptomyces sp. TG1A-8]MDO0926043.1 LAETG motif-containing sortase-dependent surface protein [Streptomyces sp. TG1A-8]
MSSARRPLLTATAAGTLLCALWFVPSANASQNTPAGATARTVSTTRVTQQTAVVSGTATTQAADASDGTRLADTGSFDTTPYVVGGSAFLAVGAGFVVYSVRRERLEF